MQPHNPIERVVIIVKENHTFDNYFGTFPGANGASLPAAQDPPSVGDPPHDHSAWLERETSALKQQYSEVNIPAYFSLARQFTLCDNYFTEVASQSEPNHLMLIAAASPIIDNASKNRTYQPLEPFNIPTLPKALEKAGLTWATYGDPAFSYFNAITALKGSPNILPWTKFDADAAAGNLPNVSWVYAPASPTDLSEHPPSGKTAGQQTVKLGSQWTADRVHNLGRSRLWPTCAIFITWDDWGRLVRPCQSGGEGQVDRQGAGARAELYEYAIQLRQPRRMPGDQSVLEAGNFQGISLAREPGEVLRSDI
jgi:phospholipase C